RFGRRWQWQADPDDRTGAVTRHGHDAATVSTDHAPADGESESGTSRRTITARHRIEHVEYACTLVLGYAGAPITHIDQQEPFIDMHLYPHGLLDGRKTRGVLQDVEQSLLDQGRMHMQQDGINRRLDLHAQIRKRLAQAADCCGHDFVAVGPVAVEL